MIKINLKYLYLFFLFIFAISSGGFAQNTVKAAEKELKSIESQIQENKEVITSKKEEQKIAKRSLGSLSRELRYTEVQLKRAKKRLTLAQHKINDTKSNLSDIESEYEEKKKVFRNRIIDIYKTKNMGMIDYIFAPENFMALINSSFYFNKIIKSDINLINDLKKQQALLEKEKLNLENQKRKIAGIQHSISKKEESIINKQRQKQRYIKLLSSEISQIEAQNKELEESSEELTAFIIKKGKNQDKYFGTGAFIKPTSGWLSSNFGYRRHPIFKRRIKHNGIDLAAPKGYKIKASDSGVILVAGRKEQYKGYGNVTVIDHGKRTSDGKRISTVYAHQSRILIKEGEFIKKGTVIGLVGATGYATGPHLHFEIRENGIPVNPLTYVKI